MPNNISEVSADRVEVGDLLDAERGWREVLKIEERTLPIGPGGVDAPALVFTCRGDEVVGDEVEVAHVPDARVRMIDEYVEVEPDESGYHERLELVAAQDASLLSDEEHEHLKLLRRRYGKPSGS